MKDFAVEYAAAGGKPTSRRSSVEEDAIMTLVALGERRSDAERLLERARQGNQHSPTTDGLVREMLRMRMVRTG
jgi:hypothetical protein